MELIKTLRCEKLAVTGCSWMLIFNLLGLAGYAQVQSGQPSSPVNVTQLDDPGSNGSADGGGSATPVAAQPPSALTPGSSAEIARELETMKLRIQQLEAQLQQRTAAEHPPMADLVSPGPDLAGSSPFKSLGLNAGPGQAPREPQASTVPSTHQESWEPFAYADWTWLNGNSREKEKPWDSKFFTPEVRFDTSFIHDFNNPRDDTMGGSTEIFRSNEVQMDQISFGGDFHWNDVRGRILTMNGMFGVTTPRNDASPARGQWYGIAQVRTATYQKRGEAITLMSIMD